MYRDFSDESKQELLKLVEDVENEKLCDFTDWMGDRWYDFEDWIGKLDIRRYIDNVNAYHRKVIDKNNTTKKKIENIFANVKQVDKAYGQIFANIEESLKGWCDYVSELDEIIKPGSGKFNGKYMTKRLDNLLAKISRQEMDCFRDRLVQDIGGELVFNEELLHEYMGRNIDELSDEEKAVLLETIARMKDTAEVYDTLAVTGGEETEEDLLSLHRWLETTDEYDNFAEVSRHYSDMYIRLLACICDEKGKEETFAAAFGEGKIEEDVLSLLGEDAYSSLKEIFDSGNLEIYAREYGEDHGRGNFFQDRKQDDGTIGNPRKQMSEDAKLLQMQAVSRSALPKFMYNAAEGMMGTLTFGQSYKGVDTDSPYYEELHSGLSSDLGNMFGSAIGYGASYTMGGPLFSKIGSAIGGSGIGGAIAADMVGDMTIGAAQSAGMADALGLEGEEAWKYMAKNMAVDLAVGAGVEFLNGAFKHVGKVKGGLNSYVDFSKVVSDIGKRTDLTDSEKIKELQNLLENSNYKTDINMPSDIQYIKGFDAKGNVIYDWPPKLGFDESTIKPISRADGLPDTWDRYGYMGGSNFADVPSTGKYTYSERAIPYVENEAAYHTGTFNNASYFDKIDAIKNGDMVRLNVILSGEGIEEVDSSYFKNLQNTYYDFIEDTADVIGSNIDATYGLKGKVAEWGDMSGGAGQYVTPLNGSTMKRLGIIN